MTANGASTLATILSPRPLVEVAALHHYYGSAPGGHLVLDDVNLTLMENEIVGLLGRSGSGKSTLLRSIAGLIRPRKGKVRFEPDETGQLPTVSMVFRLLRCFRGSPFCRMWSLGWRRKKCHPTNAAPARWRRSI